VADLIYLDTSVVLARLQAEARQPPEDLFDRNLVSSRLLQYECWNRIHARGLVADLGEDLDGILARVSFVELSEPALRRALQPWPAPVRTLDALHLATLLFLAGDGHVVTLATFDEPMARAARRSNVALAAL
jgi:predicted nucleic acid-binding protein